MKAFAFSAMAVVCLAVLLPGHGGEPPPRAVARRNTFSIVAYDPARKEWGVATASKVLAVGAGTPWARAGAGAVATQSAANVTYGPRGLHLPAAGERPDEGVARPTPAAAGREDRQVGG